MAILHGKKSTATNNVAVFLASTPTPASWITFQPITDANGLPTNVGAVWIGAAGIKPATVGGNVLTPNSATVAWPAGTQIYPYDLSQIAIVASSGGDGVQFIYGQ